MHCKGIVIFGIQKLQKGKYKIYENINCKKEDICNPSAKIWNYLSINNFSNSYIDQDFRQWDVV